MASCSGNGAKGHHKFTLNVNETGTNTSANTSTVSWSLVLSAIQNGWDWNISGINYSVNVDGNVASGSIQSYGGSGSVTIASGSKTIGHNADGSKSISFSFSISDTRGKSYTPGNASGSGSLTLTKIARYFSSTPTITLNSKTETSKSFTWKTSETCNSTIIYYKKADDSSWTSTTVYDNSGGTSSGTFTLSNLDYNTSYNVYAKCRRKDSGLESNSGTLTNSTYDYPHVIAVSSPELIIGNAQTATIYNPLSRECRVRMVAYQTTEEIGSFDPYVYTLTTEGTEETFTPVANTLYATIPQQKSRMYSMECDLLDENNEVIIHRVFPDDNDRNPETDPYRYKVVGTELPTFDVSNIINVRDSLSTAITGDNSIFIKNHNRLEFDIVPMVPNNYATVENGYYSISGDNIITQTKPYSQNNQSVLINNIVKDTITITAVDDRQMTKTITFTVDILEYDLPYITECIIARENGTGVYANVTLKGKYTYWENLQQNNGVTNVVKYRYKLKGSSDPFSDWIAIDNLTVTNTNGDWEFTALLDTEFDNTEKYDIEFQFSDILETTQSITFEVSTANALIWRDLANKRIGINKKPELTFDVNGAAGAEELYLHNNKMLWYENQESEEDEPMSEIDPSDFERLQNRVNQLALELAAEKQKRASDVICDFVLEEDTATLSITGLDLKKDRLYDIYIIGTTSEHMDVWTWLNDYGDDSHYWSLGWYARNTSTNEFSSTIAGANYCLRSDKKHWYFAHSMCHVGYNHWSR